MSGAWTTETVEACLERVSLPNGAKLQTREYKKAGKYPVIDQGQAMIAGWTDVEDGVISGLLPVIVFGDHSRTFKYVDFPFIRGADGTQILKPRKGIDPLYFYFACRSINLASRGYNRHFSLLKEHSIPIPRPVEQVRIAQTLQRVDNLVRHQEAQESATQAIKRTTLRELFSRGLRARAVKETELGAFPEDWKSVQIGTLGGVVTGTTPPTKELANYVGGTVPFVAPGDFNHGDRISATEKKITEQGLAVSRALPAEATCFVCIGSTIGKVGITTARVCATNQQINAVIASEEYDARYVFHLLTRWSEHVQRQASPSPVPILSKGAFEQISIITSGDIDEQKKIAAILDVIDDRLVVLRQKRAVAEQLMSVLMRRLLKGEVRVGELDLSSLPALRDPEAAA
jgi:type I restriction enzyme S subunit